MKLAVTLFDAPPAAPGAARKRAAPAGQPAPTAADFYVLDYVSDPKRFGDGQSDAVITLKVPKDEPALTSTLRRELEGAYLQQGHAGIEQFAMAVYGLADYKRFIESNQDEHRSGGPLKGEPLIAAMGKSVAGERAGLWKAYVIEREKLKARIASTAQGVRDAAVKRASSLEIQQSRAQILREAQRYLSLADRSTAGARGLMEDSNDKVESNQRLSGPEARKLLEALARLEAPYKQMREAQKEVLLLTLGDKGEEIIDTIWAAPQLLVGMTLAADPVAWTRKKEKELIKDRDQQTLHHATSWLMEATTDFQQRFLTLGAAYPILHRILGESAANPDALAIVVARELRRAWAACRELQDTLRKEPDAVWQFTPLLERTLQELGQQDRQFAERVAADAMQRAQGKLRPMQALNYAIQGLDTSLMFVEIPVVQLAAIALSTVGNLLELMEEYVHTSARATASRAALDPALAVTASPSWLNTGVMSVFMVICLLPVPGLLKKLRDPEGAQVGKLTLMKLAP